MAHSVEAFRREADEGVPWTGVPYGGGSSMNRCAVWQRELHEQMCYMAREFHERCVVWRREFREQVCRMADGVPWTGVLYNRGTSMNRCAVWLRDFHEQVCRMAERVPWTGVLYDRGSSMNRCVKWQREVHEQVCRMAEGVPRTGVPNGGGSSMHRCAIRIGSSMNRCSSSSSQSGVGVTPHFWGETDRSTSWVAPSTGSSWRSVALDFALRDRLSIFTIRVHRKFHLCLHAVFISPRPLADCAMLCSQRVSVCAGLLT